ncbi:hypothetical protein LTR56_015464 [Elasticomyces elasticus]|nr:hypothetical protein LTR22_022638 [Elasticomyces elasticus]KAK3634118.1 hypothetical protein LTR56_015464 [Elasticomyces elasticus]KAK4909962.1 hypothetical protein LTR49_021304 [Elasticomyces elasticus]KAK5754891.1 hypothetical protein LTS12_015014 [Elasticomyces elasticus]
MSGKTTMKRSEAPRQQYSNRDLNRLTTTDLLGLFPQPNAPNKPILSPLTRMEIPSAVGDTSGFVSREGIDMQKRRSLPQALSESHGSTGTLWSGSRGPPEACVAELDLPNLAQNDVIRPTTGMQDGYHECDTSTWNDPPQEKHSSRVTGGFSMPRSRQCCGASGEAVHTQAVQDHVPYSLHSSSRERSIITGQRLGPRNGNPNGAMTGDAAVLPAIPSSTRQDASELGPSQLQRPKALLRSSFPDDLRTTLSLEQGKLTRPCGFAAEDRIISIPLLPGVDGPPRSTRRVQAEGRILREDTSNPRTVCLDLIGSTPDLSSPAVTRRARLVDDCDPLATAIGKTKGSLKLATKKSSGHAESQSLKTLGYADRTASDLASCFPTDALYMIAVTNQEMALLVMMRRKRAVMKKSSSA